MKKLIHSQKGIVLPSVIMVMLVSLSMVGIVLTFTLSQTDTEITYENNTKALHAAEAGIHKYLWYLNKEGATITLDTVVSFPEVEPKYAYILHENVSESGMKVVTSTGWAINDPNITKEIKVTFKKRTFTQHVYFSENDPADIWWMTGEKCYGPYRTNTSIYINGSPEFYGMVYYVNQIICKNGELDTPYFYAGTKRESAMEFPASNSELKNYAETGGYYYEGRTSIRLNSNGTITVWNPVSDIFETRPLPSNGVIYVNEKSGGSSNRFDEKAGNVFVSGTLKGRLTIGASNNIYITDFDPTRENLSSATETNGVTYATTDFSFNNANKEFDVTGTGEDMLGLIANNNVVILTQGWFNNNDVNSANGDIKVYAAVFAINGSFMNSDYDKWPKTEDSDNQAKIILRGSIAQQTRGKVGMYTIERRGWGWNQYNVDVFYGYSKDYAHDTRMLTECPPYFLESSSAGWEITNWH